MTTEKMMSYSEEIESKILSQETLDEHMCEKIDNILDRERKKKEMFEDYLQSSADELDKLEEKRQRESDEFEEYLKASADELDEYEEERQRQSDEFEDELEKDAKELAIIEARGVEKETIMGNVKLIKYHKYGCYQLEDLHHNVIVPLDKYSFIDYFEQGYARVNQENPETGDKKWGIIDKEGRDIVPVIYDEIWKFYGTSRESTTMKINGKKLWFDIIQGEVSYEDPWYTHHHESIVENDYEEDDDYEERDNYEERDEYFSIDRCYDEEGNFDYERLEDAILDGEYVPEDW